MPIQPALDEIANALPWIGGALAYAFLVLLGLGLCRAAARGDRQ